MSKRPERIIKIPCEVLILAINSINLHKLKLSIKKLHKEMNEKRKREGQKNLPALLFWEEMPAEEVGEWE